MIGHALVADLIRVQASYGLGKKLDLMNTSTINTPMVRHGTNGV